MGAIIELIQRCAGLMASDDDKFYQSQTELLREPGDDSWNAMRGCR